MAASIYFNATFIHLDRKREPINGELPHSDEFTVDNADAEELQNWLAKFPAGSVFEVVTQTIYIE